LITAASVLLTWEPGAAVDMGAVLIVAACVSWGVDNGVTAGIEQLSPQQVVALKGFVAGGANLVIGLAVAGWGSTTGPIEVVAALLIGAAGYGWSITLWVTGARQLGAARAQVIFATAPFIGALVAWGVIRDPITGTQIAAVLIAGSGIVVSLRSDHLHEHRHHELDHDHEHLHDDDHHDHSHADGFTGRHSHPHQHVSLVHAHPHVPDLHHRHDH
jgi:drug/metabolite transporter (DMT)-like permease